MIVDSALVMVRTRTSGWRGRVAEANVDRLGAITAEQVAMVDGVLYAELTAGSGATTTLGRFEHDVYWQWAEILVTWLEQLDVKFSRAAYGRTDGLRGYLSGEPVACLDTL